MSLRLFAGRSLAVCCMTFVTVGALRAQDPAPAYMPSYGPSYGPRLQEAPSVYTPTYVPTTPRGSLTASVATQNPFTPLFRAILPVQAVQPVPQPTPQLPQPTMVAPGSPGMPGTYYRSGTYSGPMVGQPGVATQAAPMTPMSRPEPLEEAADYVMGTLQMDWNDASYPTASWFRADYQMSWLRGARTIPLVSRSGVNVPAANIGVVGQNTTQVLLGGGSSLWDASPSNGFRLNTGCWLNNCFGVEVGGFFLEDKASLFTDASDGKANSFALARPFVDAATGTQQALIVALAGKQSGSIDAASRAQMWGTDLNVVYREEPGRFFQTNLRAGLRYLDLEEQVQVQNISTGIGNVSIPFNGNLAVTGPDSVRVVDSFRTHNEFIGPQFGFDTTWSMGRLVFNFDARVAIGNNHQIITINGTSETISNGQTTNLVQGGLLANSSNIGRYARDTLSVIPEFELKAEYRLTPTISAFASYDILCWGDVANPGDQINSSVDVTRVPTLKFFTNPAANNSNFSLNHGNFVSQSLHVGMVLKF